ncbi:MAG: thioredoxin domain-containing protein [Actinomycetota bacterium]|nr:thioredoxin domain-containing protein [Actinomycetota bacterium]
MRRSNRLADEASPYLRQHAENPVDWYPWGPDALAEAARRDVPMFVSIGYSACHWCHVMAHESFEDEQLAAYLGEHFVSVKVDREERPDVDSLYMQAVQELNDGHGGWPLTVFTTPDGRPFFGGTYFPPVARHGAPAFAEVLRAVASAWTTRRGELDAQATELTGAVAARLSGSPGTGTAPDTSRLLDDALERAAALEDHEHGGIGRAPKFPQAPIVELLIRAADAGRPLALGIATGALDAMARGGIYDHLGGGFARYSTDRAWLVPHFEKMLYDQALLARSYCHAWQVTGSPDYLQVLTETVGYVLGDLAGASGGLHSSRDADSDGEEGRYYTWTRDELDDVLGERDGAAAARRYGVTRSGNFERGRSVLRLPPGADIARDDESEDRRARLLEARSLRNPPALDDKVLTEWNAMAAAVLAEAGSATGTRAWVDAAVGVGEFLLASSRRPDGRWMRSWSAGRATSLAVASDYAWLVECFTRLAEATGDPRWVREATGAAEGLVGLFSSPDGGWYSTGSDAERLVVRPKDVVDSATPAAGSVAAAALTRLGALTGSEALTTRAARGVAAAAGDLARSPLAFPELLAAALLADRGPVEVVVGTGAARALVDTVHRRYLPDVVLAWGAPGPGPLWEGRDASGERRAFVCRRGSCLAPVEDPTALLDAIAVARDPAA